MTRAITTHDDDGNGASATVSTPAPPAPGWAEITTARELLPAGSVEGNHELWQATRLQGLGGSELAAILGLHPFESAYGIWLAKTGRGKPKRDTWAMARGRYYEPAVAQRWSDENGVATKRMGTWARLDAPWAMCNPDRCTADGLGLEIKMPASEWSGSWQDGPARYAVIQGIWCAWILGLPAWYLTADLAQGRSPTLPTWLLDMDEWAEALAYWIEIADWWWYRYVVSDTPPPVDGSEATAEALNRAYRYPVRLGEAVMVPGLRGVVAERGRLKTVIKDAETDLKVVENRIKAVLQHDEAGCDVDGVPIIAWRPTGTDPDDPALPKTRTMREIKPKKAPATRKRSAVAATAALEAMEGVTS